jgi:hypothetical protein
MTDVILAVLGRPRPAHFVLNAAQCLAARFGRVSIVVLAVDAVPAVTFWAMQGGSICWRECAREREPPPFPRCSMTMGSVPVCTSCRSGRNPFGKTLPEELLEPGTDMRVMGAYGHSRLGEMIFGGATSYIPEHADMRVRMRQ